jgi:hypothetical protein
MDDRLRDRIENQAHDHWHELSIIIASADIVLAIVLIGHVFTRGSGSGASLILLGIAIASTLCTVLAYYSIQIGQLTEFGPLHLPHILGSFLVAATQLALFLWPTHVESQHWRSPTAELNSLRHWLLLYASFCFVAVAVISYSVRIRRSSSLAPIAVYEAGQRIDRFSALGAGVFSICCWALTFHWQFGALLAGVLFAIGASLAGLASQAHVAKGLRRSLMEADDEPITRA